MERETYDECEIGAEMLVEDSVYQILDKNKGLLQLVQFEYELEYDDNGSNFFTSISDLEQEIADLESSKEDISYTIDKHRLDKPFWQHYKDIEEPDFYVPEYECM